MVSPTAHLAAKEAGPAWDVARLFPNQGSWSEEEYLALTDSTNQLVEFTNGRIEVLPMPTLEHQRICRFVFRMLEAFVLAEGLGEVLFAPYRVKVARRLFREPDILFMSEDHKDRLASRYSTGVDLAVEIVSDDPESKKRDHVKKRRDYAKGGVTEYWIIDPSIRTVRVLRLHGKSYRLHGEWVCTGTLTSPLLRGFSLDTADIWLAYDGKLR